MSNDLVGKTLGVDVTEADLAKRFPVLRIWYPDTFGTMDYVLSRVNVYVDKDGKITKVSNG